MELKQELIIVLDFGGQYNQLVARRVRENNVYCEIYSYKTSLEEIKKKNPKGIILTGGPDSCYLPDQLHIQKSFLNLEFLYLDYATVHSLCSICLVER